MKVSVARSAIIDAPVKTVWNELRDFNGHHLWHPAISHSEMENGLEGDVVGGVRRFTLTDGAELREQLLRHSDLEQSYTYCILDSPLPLRDYVATVQLRTVTDGNRTFWSWKSTFHVPANRRDELEQLVSQGVYENGFSGFRRYLADKHETAGEESAFAKPPLAKTPIATDESLPAEAVDVKAFGDPSVMSLEKVTVPPPQPHEIRIRQAAIGVNYLGIKHRTGIAPGFRPPGTIGVEGSGEIIDVGNAVSGFFPGDRIAYVNKSPGSYSTILCIEANRCIPVPKDVTSDHAALILKGFTAGLLLCHVFNVTPGSTILIQSVAGGLGHLLSQWAKSLNLTVIGTVSNNEKARFARDQGCDYPLVVENSAGLVSEVVRITNGHGVDYLAYNGKSEDVEETLDCMARFGHCAVVGDRDGRTMTVDVKILKRRSLTLSVPVCFDYAENRSLFQRLTHSFFDRLEKRVLIPAVESFPLSEVGTVHTRIENRQNTGAVLLQPNTIQR